MVATTTGADYTYQMLRARMLREYQTVADLRLELADRTNAGKIAAEDSPLWEAAIDLLEAKYGQGTIQADATALLRDAFDTPWVGHGGDHERDVTAAKRRIDGFLKAGEEEGMITITLSYAQAQWLAATLGRDDTLPRFHPEGDPNSGLSACPDCSRVLWKVAGTRQYGHATICPRQMRLAIAHRIGLLIGFFHQDKRRGR